MSNASETEGTVNDYEKFVEACEKLELEIDGMDSPGDEDIELRLQEALLSLIEARNLAESRV